MIFSAVLTVLLLGAVWAAVFLLQLHGHAVHTEDLRLSHVGHGLFGGTTQPHGGEAAHADVADRRHNGRAVGTPLADDGLGASPGIELVVGDAFFRLHPLAKLD